MLALQREVSAVGTVTPTTAAFHTNGVTKTKTLVETVTANDSEGHGTATTGKGKRHYERFAKWPPRIQNTHNTLDCGLWNEDGSKKARGPRGGNKPRGDRRYNNRISAGDGAVDDAANELSKMKLQMKKYRKKAKKAKKNARRARRGGYASSSDSSSSSSSS